ncbi:hypothetical protein ACX1NX_01715 [Acinetobacter sp. ANC 5383]
MSKMTNIEWLSQHLHGAKSVNYEQQNFGGGEKEIPAWELRCACFAKIETKLAKALACLLVWGHKEKQAYLFVQSYLANIMIQQADKVGLEPKYIELERFAYLIARLVIDFELEPQLGEFYTSKGRLYYAGISVHQMTYDAYRKTWRDFERLMEVAITNARWEVESAVTQYRKDLKEVA